MLQVQFRQYRSGHIWTAAFDLGSDWENRYAALTLAWKRGAEIIATL